MGLSRWEGLNNWGHTEDTLSMITPPNETDSIKNAIPSKLTEGACPPQWYYGLFPTTQLEPETEMGDFK